MGICYKHIWPAFKFILFAGTPIQNIFDMGGDTHLFINNQALRILKNDSIIDTACLLEKYRNFIDLGNLWADKGYKNLAHYYNPENGKGIIPFVSAVSECQSFFDQAILNWKSGKKQKAMFYLGAAAHIVQDICVPHHAKGIALNGHRKFEQWVMKNRDCFKLSKYGSYDGYKNIKDLIDSNATTAQKYYKDVSSYNVSGYTRAGKELLGLAQRTTAFFYNYFFHLLNNSSYK